jgi:isopentenyl-diphosphate delta-isomerase
MCGTPIYPQTEHHSGLTLHHKVLYGGVEIAYCSGMAASASQILDDEEQVILVDSQDRELGTAQKLAAHRDGRLHRAVSAFIFDGRGLLLLQRRSVAKYHSGGLWSNACCTHPRPGEDVEAAAHRRLLEEMGFDCPLTAVSSFIYRAEFHNGLVEHEFDHLLVGQFDGSPVHDPNEVAEWRWAAFDQVLADVTANADQYTAWFGLALDELRRGGNLNLTPNPLYKEIPIVNIHMT